MDVSQVSCVLCHRREETEESGALSTKADVTAHQNCLLFSSGLFCRNSPQFDDLFGFTVEDVLNEVKRGSKLMCNKCKKKGATAGCEVKRCKKSYHYPCAVQDGANNVEDADQGKYGLYCFNHYQETQRHNDSVNGRPASFTQCRPSNRASEAGSSKLSANVTQAGERSAGLLPVRKRKGRISLDSLSNSVVVSHCHKRAPASRQSNGDSTAARRLLACSSSDSDPCGSMTTPSSTKRKLSFRDKREGGVSKRKGWNVISTDDSSNSDESESEMAMFAPVDTDFEESANSVPEARLIRKDGESPTGSTSGNQVEDASVGGNDEGDETIMHSDAGSESLLLPVCRSPSTQTVATQSPRMVLVKSEEAAARRLDRGSGPVHSPSPHRSPPCTSSAIPLLRALAPPPPLAPPSDPSLSFDSTRFWKSCNKAGCTRALFTGFINEMNAISSRIQSDLASQEDYDHALTVMNASGKLEGLVAEQQEELQRKQTELLTASGAMKEVVSALKTRVHQQKL